MNKKTLLVLAICLLSLAVPAMAEEFPPPVFVTAKSDFRDNLFIFFKNTSDSPLVIKDIFVDDKDIGALATKNDKLPWNEAKVGIVRWYDIVPMTVKAQDYGLVRIRFGAKGEIGRSIKVKLLTEDGKEFVNGSFDVEKELPVDFSYYSFDASLRNLTLYLDAPQGTEIKKLFLGGRELPFTDKEIAMGESKKHLLSMALPENALEGEYKILFVCTNKGFNASLIKVIRPFFSLGMFRLNKDDVGKLAAGPPPEEWLRDCKEHFINTLAYVWEKDGIPDLALKYGMKMSFCCSFEGSAKKGKEFANHPATWDWSICDEPEGWSCPPMRLMKAVKALRENAPMANYSQVYCTRLAFFEYNFDDLPFADYYPVATSPLEGCGRMLETLKYAAKPNPIGFIPQAFRGGISKKSGNSNLARWARFPTPEEERLMVYDAVANGAKAIHYFAYNIEPNEPVFGVGETDEKEAKKLWAEIQKINAELEILSPYLWAADTCQLAKSDEKNLEIRTLVDKDAILIFLVNRDYSYTKEGFSAHPKKDSKIKIALPAWFTPWNIFGFDWQGLKKLTFSNKSGELEISVPEINSTQIILIPASEDVYLNILGRCFDTINPIGKLAQPPSGDKTDVWSNVSPIVIDGNYAAPQYYYSANYKESDDLNAKVYLGWDDKNFYITAKVKDNVFRQNKEPDNIWAEDALQVAFDSGNNSYGALGYNGDDLEYGFALTPNGPVCYCWQNPDKNKMGLRKDISTVVKRSGTDTIYEAAIPISELNLKPDKLFGFNFLVVDTDTGSYWNGPKFLQLAPGIIGGKNPSAFKKFILVGGEK